MQKESIKRRRKFLDYRETEALKKAWGYKCAYCEVEQESLVIDHIVPFAKGGPCELSNFAPACKRCNARKTDNELPESYLALILAVAKGKAKSVKRQLRPKKSKTSKVSVKGKKKNKKPFVQVRQYKDIEDVWGSVPDCHKKVFSVILDNLGSSGYAGCDYGTTKIDYSILRLAGISEQDCYDVVGYKYLTEFYSEAVGEWRVEQLIPYCGGMGSREGAGYLSFGLSKDFVTRVPKLLSNN